MKRTIGIFALALMSSAANAQDLTVIVGTGVQGDSFIKAYVEPFEQETGLKVRSIKDQTTYAKILLQVENNNVDFDIVGFPPTVSTLYNDGALEQIDYTKLNPELMAQLPQEAKRPWGVQTFSYTWVLGLNSEKYPEGQPAPQSWADVWDAEKFPGTRSLESGEWGFQGPLEQALLADGVPMDQLYPLDIDRAFKSLDKIKPKVRKWWKTGAEMMQTYQSRSADMGMGFDGRFSALAKEGEPFRIVWNEAKMTGFYWVIPKGAKNAENAYRFIDFATRADRQAEFGILSGYGPVNPKAFEHIPEEIAKQMATYPDNMAKSFMLNDAWYAEKGDDGKTNIQRIAERWNAWITQ